MSTKNPRYKKYPKKKNRKCCQNIEERNCGFLDYFPFVGIQNFFPREIE